MNQTTLSNPATASSSLTEQRIRGCLYGLAAGERNGGPVRMALRVGQSLAAHRGFDAEDIFSRYRHWWQEGAIDTGNVFAMVMTRMDYDGLTRREAVSWVDNKLKGRTAGVNPAHRVAPLACCFSVRDGELASMAREEAQLTHASPIAADASAFVAVLLRALIRGEDWQRALALAEPQIQHPQSRLTRQAPLLPLDENGFAPTVLANALHFVEQANSFAAALTASIRHAGGANYSPVLVGAIAGALYAPDCRALAIEVHGEALMDQYEVMVSALVRAQLQGERQ